MSNAFDGFDPQEKIKELIQKNSRLTADYERAIGRCQYLDAEIAALRAALEAVEWSSLTVYGPACAWCGGYMKDGHAPDCQRQAALGLSKEATDV